MRQLQEITNEFNAICDSDLMLIELGAELPDNSKKLRALDEEREQVIPFWLNKFRKQAAEKILLPYKPEPTKTLHYDFEE